MPRQVFLPLYQGTGGDPILVFGLHLLGDLHAIRIPESVINRLRCHLLLAQLPDQALSEAMESLSGMYDFYRWSPPPLPPLLPAKLIPVRITGSYAEPVYPVTEE